MRRNKAFSSLLFQAALWISLAGLTSCEKEVQFNLKDEGSRLVVEGSIETGQPPIVKLSKSIGFFSTVDLQTLADAFVHDAVIKVSDGQDSVTLKEYQDSLSLFFYTVDNSHPQDLQFLGVPGKTYQLSITYDGKRYTSQTTIPFPKPLDSVWALTPPPEEIPKKYPDARLLYVQYTDPDTPGNQIRYFTKRNAAPFLSPVFSVYNDEIINGKTIQLQMPAGMDKRDYDPETFGYFYKGDTVIIKWCAIDRKAYDFWNTLAFSSGSAGNPFSSPVEVGTNIQGGALGVWVGYGATFDTLYIRD